MSRQQDPPTKQSVGLFGLPVAEPSWELKVSRRCRAVVSIATTIAIILVLGGAVLVFFRDVVF